LTHFSNVKKEGGRTDKSRYFISTNREGARKLAEDRAVRILRTETTEDSRRNSHAVWQ